MDVDRKKPSGKNQWPKTLLLLKTSVLRPIITGRKILKKKKNQMYEIWSKQEIIEHPDSGYSELVNTEYIQSYGKCKSTHPLDL